MLPRLTRVIRNDGTSEELQLPFDELLQQSMLGELLKDGGEAASQALRTQAEQVHELRVKSLQQSGPLHYFLYHTDQRDTTWNVYDFSGLQVTALEIVIDKMGKLDDGITRSALISELAKYASAMAPDRDSTEHARVATVVIGWLLNDDDREDVFSTFYFAGPQEGPLRQKPHHIQFLRESEDANRNVLIRATPEAINLLLYSLSDEVEDAQRADERLLQDAIENGRLPLMLKYAMRARTRSIQYADMMVKNFGRAEQDLASIDWSGEIMRNMEEALTHIRERLRDENHMVTQLEKMRRKQGHDSEVAGFVREVIDLVADCRTRHTALLKQLVRADSVFRTEQERQRFTKPAPFANISLREAFDSLLARPVDLRPDDPREAFLESLAGVDTPLVLDLGQLVAEMFAPVREVAPSLPEIEEPDLAEGEVLARFPKEFREAVDRAVFTPALQAPRRLSRLLWQARRAFPENAQVAAEYVVLRALELYAPENEALGTLISENDGRPLEDVEYGGDDLLVGPSVRQPSPAEPMAASEG